jgi:hypothetical protein
MARPSAKANHTSTKRVSWRVWRRSSMAGIVNSRFN